MRVTEAGGRVKALEPRQGAEALFNRPVTLLQEVIRIPRRAMDHGRPERQANCPG